MIKTGTTRSGFKFTVDSDQLNDLDFIEDLGKADENPVFWPRVMRAAFGDEQYARFKAHIRTENGKAPFDTALEEFTEILNLANAKNS